MRYTNPLELILKLQRAKRSFLICFLGVGLCLCLRLKLFYFGAHYRSKLNFTWEALQASANALEKLRGYADRLKTVTQIKPTESVFLKAFREAMEDDLNSPQALAEMWNMLKSEISDEEKAYTLAQFDLVLGLDLFAERVAEEIPASIRELASQRQQAKDKKDFAGGDAPYLCKLLKNRFFADAHLVLKGLNSIN
jgi:cysteinyl-tRNA synthetase